MNQDKINKVFMECYRRMFKEAEPVGDIDKIIKSGEGRMEGFFLAYYLLDERQEEIMKEVFKEFKVTKFHQRGLRSTIILGSSPCGNKDTVLKERKDYNKRLKKFLNYKGKKE